MQIIRKAPEKSEVSQQTEKIISAVREGGDKALLDLTNRFDGTHFGNAGNLFVSSNEVKRAFSKIKPSEVNALKQQLRQIRALSKMQMERFEEKDA